MSSLFFYIDVLHKHCHNQNICKQANSKIPLQFSITFFYVANPQTEKGLASRYLDTTFLKWFRHIFNTHFNTHFKIRQAVKLKIIAKRKLEDQGFF